VLLIPGIRNFPKKRKEKRKYVLCELTLPPSFHSWNQAANRTAKIIKLTTGHLRAEKHEITAADKIIFNKLAASASRKISGYRFDRGCLNIPFLVLLRAVGLRLAI